MSLTSSSIATGTMSVAPTGTTSSDVPNTIDDPVPAHHASPVVAFIIGLSIIILASILNAGGLNLTKLDHVSVTLGHETVIYFL